MYKYSDKMFFDEDENYIKSLALRSHKKVMCVCPGCNKERMLKFYGVCQNKTTWCSSCVQRERGLENIIGSRFGRLTVLSAAGVKNKKQQVLCQCDCGKTAIVLVIRLKNGSTRSCGCIHTEIMKARKGVLHPSFGKRGKDSPRYNQNVSDESRLLAIKERRNSEAVHFRKAVRERDGACVVCDSTKDLVVHHLENFKNNESLRYEISNGVTLCRACHQEFHTVFLGGYQVPCTEQDFNNYVSQI